VGTAWHTRVFNLIEWTTSPAAAQAGPVVPAISMIQNPTLGGNSLFADSSGIGLEPTLAWAVAIAYRHRERQRPLPGTALRAGGAR
jgi:hypothetical protein